MSNPSDLTKQRLVSFFGEPQHSFDLPAAGAGKFERRMDEFQATVRQGQSAGVRMSANSEFLVYPAIGIEFWMRANVLCEIEIMKKVEQNAAPLPSAPAGPSEGAR
jgi:hypothetical protein